ncbi:MAG: hypothetical protein GY744_06980 [Gammaproteobacteria bacterium]|nr:hypothetical protein [Gammaproteobacteria bacterium]
MKFLKLALTAVGLLASLVSTWFSVELYTSFANTGLDKMVYTACGISMQSMQLLVYVCSWFYYWQGKKSRAVIGFTCFISLMVLSIIASLGFFSVVNKKTTTAATQNSDVYQGMKDRLASIDAEIANLQNNIATYAGKGMITKGVRPTQQRIDQLRQERQEVLNRVDSYKLTPDADALYAYLAEFTIGKDYTREDVQRIKLWIYLLSAICLDVVSAVLLGFSLDFDKGAISDIPDPAPSRSAPAIQKSHTGQSIPAISPVAGGNIAKSDGADIQHMHIQQLSAQNELLQRRLEQLEQQAFQSFKEPVIKEPPVIKESVIKQKEPMSHALITEYINALFSKSRPDGSLVGRNSIADVIGISYRDAATIHNFLKTSGFISVKGNSTFPVYDREQILAEISKGNGA